MDNDGRRPELLDGDTDNDWPMELLRAEVRPELDSCELVRLDATSDGGLELVELDIPGADEPNDRVVDGDDEGELLDWRVLELVKVAVLMIGLLVGAGALEDETTLLEERPELAELAACETKLELPTEAREEDERVLETASDSEEVPALKTELGPMDDRVATVEIAELDVDGRIDACCEREDAIRLVEEASDDVVAGEGVAAKLKL